MTSRQPFLTSLQGCVRTVVGQGRLVLAERFPQFRGLVDRSQEEQGDMRVQLGDLQGFWEMIFIQVTVCLYLPWC